MGKQTGGRQPDGSPEGSGGVDSDSASSRAAEVMRRLVEERDIDWSPVKARALDLLRAAAPYQEAPGRKERVRIALAGANPRSARVLLRQMSVVAILVGAGAGASAAVWHWPERVVDAYQRLMSGSVPPSVPVSPERQAPRRTVARAFRLTAPETSPAPVAAPNLVATSEKTLASVVNRGIRPHSPPRHEAAARLAMEQAAPPRASEDTATAPVLAAMRALRRAHDPVRARELLDAYLEGYPGGALAEEALALSIEAAVAHGDPDAGALANRYLRLYPSGPFRALARQTLAAPSTL